LRAPSVLIRAPSNLGLRPLRPGHEPGTWRAPEALTQAGLVEALAPSRIVDLHRPQYETEAQAGTRLRNGQSIRAFDLALAEAVTGAADARQFPIVVGGDCSILPGALAGLRRLTPLSLVHIDGHSDFRHPGNYDAAAGLAAAAGMDLALATGRGEAMLTEWPGVPAPLVPDAQVVQIGEREGRNADYAWPDVNDTAITRIDVFTAREIGPTAALDRARSTLARTGWPFWIHFDVDVLDQLVLPAVDSPGSPGIDPADATFLLRALASDRRCAGITVTIFDPDLDPDGAYARLVVSLLGEAFRRA
jgi:arginase